MPRLAVMVNDGERHVDGRGCQAEALAAMKPTTKLPPTDSSRSCRAQPQGPFDGGIQIPRTRGGPGPAARSLVTHRRGDAEVEEEQRPAQRKRASMGAVSSAPTIAPIWSSTMPVLSAASRSARPRPRGPAHGCGGQREPQTCPDPRASREGQCERLHRDGDSLEESELTDDAALRLECARSGVRRGAPEGLASLRRAGLPFNSLAAARR